MLRLSVLDQAPISEGSSAAAALQVVPGDSDRGAKLFETEQCIQCHSVNGRGGKIGPDLSVVGPCPIEAFNNAAFGALVGSNPTQPLPPEYPSEKAFFTVTFYYNEHLQ